MSQSQRSSSLICGWDNCNRKFSTLKSLVGHLSDDHVGFKKEKYSCLWVDCPRARSTQSSRFALISHLRSHTGEKPYVCPASNCTREFTRSDSLNKHIRAHHPDLALPKADSQHGSSQHDSDQGYDGYSKEVYDETPRSRPIRSSRRDYQNQKLSSPQVERSPAQVSGSSSGLNSHQKYSLLKSKLMFIQDERELYLGQLKQKKEKIRLLEAEKHLLLSSLMALKEKLKSLPEKRRQKREKKKLLKLSALEAKKGKRKPNAAPRRRRNTSQVVQA